MADTDSLLRSLESQEQLLTAASQQIASALGGARDRQAAEAAVAAGEAAGGAPYDFGPYEGEDDEGEGADDDERSEGHQGADDDERNGDEDAAEDDERNGDEDEAEDGKSGKGRWSKHSDARLIHAVHEEQAALATIAQGKSRPQLDAGENPWDVIARRWNDRRWRVAPDAGVHASLGRRARHQPDPALGRCGRRHAAELKDKFKALKAAFVRIQAGVTKSGSYDDHVEHALQPYADSDNKTKQHPLGTIYAYLYAVRFDIVKLCQKMLDLDLQMEHGLPGGSRPLGQAKPSRTSKTPKRRDPPNRKHQSEEHESDYEDHHLEDVMSQSVAAIQAIQKSFSPQADDPNPGNKAAEERAKKKQKLEAWKAKQDVASQERDYVLRVANSADVSHELKGRAEEKIGCLMDRVDFAKAPSPLSD